jgi:hypothetical protein
MIWDERLKAHRAAAVEDCAAEIAKTHGVDRAELAKQPPVAKMEQKESEPARCTKARDDLQVKRIKHLLYKLDSQLLDPLPARLQNQLMGSDGLRPLAAAMTILLTDYGGTAPRATCEAIEEAAPSLYRAWGYSHVLAVCEEIQHSEIPEQSRLYQRMFQRFNIRYFSGSLPDYIIRVVYDVWYWETERCGYPPSFPYADEAVGFIDFTGRQIFLRFLGFHIDGFYYGGDPDPRDGPRRHRWRPWRELASRDGPGEGFGGAGIGWRYLTRAARHGGSVARTRHAP